MSLLNIFDLSVFTRPIIKQKIREILAKNLIFSQSLSEIIFKNGHIAFSVDFKELKLNKEQAQNAVKIAEEKIKKIKGVKKVTIILTFEKNSQPEKQEAIIVNKKNKQGSEILPVAGVKKIIAVASAKGGVGKSTIAANLAISLKRIGYNVALVDADIYGPSIPLLMNLKDKPQNKNGLLEPLISYGVKCISVGSLIDESSAGVWRGPMITKILYQLIRSVNWMNDGKEVDVMIIDMPPGTGDVYLSIAEKFPLEGVVIVSTPQSLAVADVVRSIDCFKKLDIQILGIIQNMSYLENNGEKTYMFGRDGAKNLAMKMQIKFLGEIPLMQEMSQINDNLMPLCESYPSSVTAMKIGQIAEKIIDKIN